jgi:hypothetical protein
MLSKWLELKVFQIFLPSPFSGPMYRWSIKEERRNGLLVMQVEEDDEQMYLIIKLQSLQSILFPSLPFFPLFHRPQSSSPINFVFSQWHWSKCFNMLAQY